MRIGSVWRQFKAGTGFVFAIISKERGELIGELALHILNKQDAHGQVAYWIAEPLWGSGLATEAVSAVLPYGFETLNLDLLFGDCHDYNEASIKVLKNNGFKKHSENQSLHIYALTKEEYKATRSASESSS